jgi:hypothetical protein
LQLGFDRAHVNSGCQRLHHDVHRTSAGSRLDEPLSRRDGGIEVHNFSGAMPLSTRQAQEVLRDATAAENLLSRN